MSAAMARRWHAGRTAPSLDMEQAGRVSNTPGLSCGVVVEPRRNRTGDPILTIDARAVHNAV
jgi:hypothetical protein